jgi:hypothetical protein
MSENEAMNKFANQIMIAFILIISSACIWKICSLIGEDTVFVLIIICFISCIGLLLILWSSYMIVEEYGKDEFLTFFKLIIGAFVIWIITLIIILSKGYYISCYRNIYGEFLSFKKVTIINYTYLSVTYLINYLLTAIIPIILSAMMYKALPQLWQSKTNSLIRAGRELQLTYIFSIAVCIIITSAFLITGEHRSTPVVNSILNILYLAVLVNLIWCFFTYFHRIKKYLKEKEINTLPENEKLPNRNFRLLIRFVTVTAAVVCSIMVVTGYSPEKDFIYFESRDFPGTIELYEYIGEQPHVKVPSKIDGKLVTDMRLTFRNLEFIKSVSLQEGIKRIGSSCFEYCYNLKSVSLPKSLEIIDSSAFENCSRLEEISIPSGVTKIDSFAFRNCRSISDIVLPEALTYIGYGAFINCSSFESIAIPRNVEEISVSAFLGCDHLTHVDISDNVSILGKSSFSDCSSLKEIDIPDNVSVIAKEAFEGCTKLERVILPKNLKRIEIDAFNDCGMLKQIEIPESIDYVDQDAFGKQNNIIEIIYIK